MWKAKFGRNSAQTEFIDGTNDCTSIADSFESKFEQACSQNSPVRSYELYKEFLRTFDEYTGSHAHINIVSAETVYRCLSIMKWRKARS